MPDYKARRRLLAPSVQGGMESPEDRRLHIKKENGALFAVLFCRHRAVVLKWQDI